MPDRRKNGEIRCEWKTSRQLDTRCLFALPGGDWTRGKRREGPGEVEKRERQKEANKSL